MRSINLNEFQLQPKASVVTRACYLLECAHFVHQCNRGQWPSWLKAQLPPFRPSKQGVYGQHPLFGGGGRMGDASSPGVPITVQSVQQRRAIAMQLQASKAFHQWAEVKQ